MEHRILRLKALGLALGVGVTAGCRTSGATSGVNAEPAPAAPTVAAEVKAVASTDSCSGNSFCPEFLIAGGSTCTATDQAGVVVASDVGGNGCFARKAVIRAVCRQGRAPAELKIACHEGAGN